MGCERGRFSVSSPGRTAAVVLAIVVIVLIPVNIAAQPVNESKPFGPSSTHIDHIVIIMMENRAFDNFYGTYCTAGGAGYRLRKSGATAARGRLPWRRDGCVL